MKLRTWGAASVIGALGAAAAVFLEPRGGAKRRRSAKKVTKKATKQGVKVVQRERAHVAAMVATVRKSPEAEAAPAKRTRRPASTPKAS